MAAAEAAGRVSASADWRGADCRRYPGSPALSLLGEQVGRDSGLAGLGQAGGEMSLTGSRPEEKQSRGERNVGIPPGSGSGFTPG